MIDFIVDIDYDIFRPSNLENWEASLKSFYKRFDKIESDAKLIIDRCIPELHSTEHGIHMLQSIDKDLYTRRILVDYMLTKFDSVIKKFLNEIEMVQLEFQVGFLNTTRNERFIIHKPINQIYKHTHTSIQLNTNIQIFLIIMYYYC